MVINTFKNKTFPLADGSYSQYFEAEPEETDIYWVEKPENFINLTDNLNDLKKGYGVKEGFNVNFDKRNKKKKFWDI